MPGKPLLQALWLVDDADRDPETGKVDVRGMFDLIEVKDPSREFTATAYLFCALRGLHGPVKLNLRYTDLEDESILIDRPLAITHDDPLITLDLKLLLRRIPVPHEGVYVWELIWENEVLGSSRLTAKIV